MWPRPVVTTKLIGMAAPQLALHLPDQIAELAARADPSYEWQIPCIDGVPVYVSHVFGPEVVALQPPRFPIHLFPLALGIDGQLDPA